MTIHHRSLKLLAMFCLSLGCGIVQTEVLTAQSRFNAGINWEPFESENNFSSSEQKSENRPELQTTNAEPNSKQVGSRDLQSRVNANSLRELSVRLRSDAARRVEPYLGKSTAWQGYPSAEAIQLPPKQAGSNTNRLVAPLIIRSPFADFSTTIPTISTAHPSQRNAEMSFRNGDYSEARSSVNAALKFDPKNGNMLMFATMNNLAVGDFENAGKLFVTAAIILDVENWNNVFAMADQFYGNDDDERHLADFFEFCETSDNVNARRLRGFLAFELQQFETAQHDFEFVIKNVADDAIVKKLLASGGESSESQSSTGDTAMADPRVIPAKSTINPPTN